MIVCEVITFYRRRFAACKGAPRWRMFSRINSAIVTHCCDHCVEMFLLDKTDEGDQCWQVETLGLAMSAN